MEKQLLPQKIKILSGSMLKLIAVISMLIDHIASHLVDKSFVLVSIAGHDITLYRIMRDFGRMAFPIFCFLLIEGFIHTRSRVKYGISLLITAVISEVPWDLVHKGVLLEFRMQNVFFTLLIGFSGLCIIEGMKKLPVLKVLILTALGALTVLLNTDFSIKGYCFIILLYALRQNEIVRPFTAFLLNNHWWALTGFIPISLYNGKRGFIKGPVLKYAFYAFYPAHLFVIYLFKAGIIKTG